MRKIRKLTSNVPLVDGQMAPVALVSHELRIPKYRGTRITIRGREQLKQTPTDSGPGFGLLCYSRNHNYQARVCESLTLMHEQPEGSNPQVALFDVRFLKCFVGNRGGMTRL